MIKKTLLIITILTASLLAQGRGTPSQLRVKVDANGYLLTAGAGQTNPITSCTFNNCRLAVDASGNLLTTLSGSSTTTGSFTSQKDAIGSTSTDGFLATNTTAADSMTTLQISPRFRMHGNVWDTGAAASRTTDAWWEDHPISGNPFTNQVRLYMQDNGGTAYFPMSVGPFIPGVSTYSAIWFANSAANPSTTNFAFLGNNASTDNVLNVGTGGTLSLRVANASQMSFTANTIRINTTTWQSVTAPTIGSGGCTSPAISHSNGTAAFLVTIGTSCTGVKTVVLTMPAAAHFWHVQCDNNTSDAQQQTNYVVSRATSTTAVTITSYDRVTGLQEDFTASDTLLCSAAGE